MGVVVAAVRQLAWLATQPTLAVPSADSAQRAWCPTRQENHLGAVVKMASVGHRSVVGCCVRPRTGHVWKALSRLGSLLLDTVSSCMTET